LKYRGKTICRTTISVQANFLNPNFNYPVIFVNFNSSRDEELNNNPKLQKQRLSGEEKNDFCVKLLNQLYQIINGSPDKQRILSLAKTLVYDSFDNIQDEENGLLFKELGRDLRKGENDGFKIVFKRINSRELFDLYIELLEMSGKEIFSSCKLFGNIKRISTILDLVRDNVSYISFGSTQTYSNTYSTVGLWEKIQRQNYREDSEELLRKAIVSNDMVEKLLSIADTLSYESFSIKWNTLGSWQTISGNKRKPFYVESLFENYISILKNNQGKINLYVVIGEYLSNKKIISAVEEVVGKKFKQVYI
jgi:hypothetical protein